MPQPDKNTVTLSAVKGVDNRSEETKLRPGFVRAATNVDISEAGVVTRRDGYFLLADLYGAHSLWSNDFLSFGLVADTDSLYKIEDNGDVTQLVTGLTGQPVYYVMTARNVYWSNGSQNGRVTQAGEARAWGVPTPLPSFSVLATPTGGMIAGCYQLTVTYTDDQREESGAPEPVIVDVPEGGGITLSGLSPTPAQIRAQVIYMTGPNGTELKVHSRIAAGVTATQLGRPTNPNGPLLTTLLREVFPPARYLTATKGRIFGLVGRRLVWTDPLYYGLSELSKNFITLPDTGVMLACPESEQFHMYVGTRKKTYQVAGSTIDQSSPSIVLHQGVIEGSCVLFPAEVLNLDGVTTPTPVWVAADGIPYVGTAQGVIPAHKSFVYPGYTTAASLFVDIDGKRRYIVSGKGGSKPSTLAAKDRVVARVYDNGGGI